VAIGSGYYAVGLRKFEAVLDGRINDHDLGRMD
jgi:hypothetical protein